MAHEEATSSTEVETIWAVINTVFYKFWGFNTHKLHILVHLTLFYPASALFLFCDTSIRIRTSSVGDAFKLFITMVKLGLNIIENTKTDCI